ncbi:MAG TPA: hypothetical protein VMZ49_00540 [Patescibacteria group bacterium]|nr:hypothetical protein [Patescibacteria group bacterium]
MAAALVASENLGIVRLVAEEKLLDDRRRRSREPRPRQEGDDGPDDAGPAQTIFKEKTLWLAKRKRQKLS